MNLFFRRLWTALIQLGENRVNTLESVGTMDSRQLEPAYLYVRQQPMQRAHRKF